MYSETEGRIWLTLQLRNLSVLFGTSLGLKWKVFNKSVSCSALRLWEIKEFEKHTEEAHEKNY